MKYVYAAIFTKTDDGYAVQVPDLPGCVTAGSDLVDTFDMAQDAITMWLWDAENRHEDIPNATALNDVQHGSESFVSLVAADTDKYRKENDARAIKKTLSIPAWLNKQAEDANAPFSQILQKGLKDFLDIR